jgi:hypothetical protein
MSADQQSDLEKHVEMSQTRTHIGDVGREGRLFGKHAENVVQATNCVLK